MILNNRFLFLFVLIPAFSLNAQVAFDFSDDSVISRLVEDIYTLASDEMEGREAGTEGERKAAAFIKERMQEAELEPLFNGSFYQEFPFPGDWVWGMNNTLSINEQEFEHGVDFYVLPGSASGTWTSSVVDVGFGLSNLEDIEGFEDYCDYEGFDDLDGKIFMMEFFMPEALDTLADRGLFRLIFQKIRLAGEKGAAGIVFVNTRSTRDDPPVDLRISRRVFDLPVLFAGEKIATLIREDAPAQINIQTDLYREDNTGINVAGYLDNQAAYTVVIGAHDDHIGYGGRGSRSPDLHAIHPGADDNASGTAGVLEKARFLSATGLATQYNYIFIAFSAEEKGLVGSRYFTESDAYDMEKINYMFNLDMIGRMEDNSLSLIGTGSSPTWETLIDANTPENINIQKNPRGRGGSDHTSFYVKDIPVLFFFTGIHEDYHRPEDTAERINYEGAGEIISFGINMVLALDSMEKLAFTQSSAPAPERTREDIVTLGLMPDHAFNGEGLRVLAVSDDRPAKRAGIQNGDIIIRINDIQILEIHTYMEALGNIRTNQTITVVVQRDDEEIEIEVQV